ncbi:phage tail protein I [uncultured Megasphaera sp.]|uniref:phage tail protein I n=1 Tax=uncultured Megasphaera sp. TaxID=165188 RepID=UPI0025978D21|nr:phage tail protein I [uncultured Megasphaera sp.]
MSSLSNLNIIDITPSSISSDTNIVGLANMLTSKLLEVDAAIDMIRLFPKISAIPEAAVDLLAWQYSVDFYSTDLPRDAKENLVVNSIAWHRRKGTVSVVEDMVYAVYATAAEVVENWEYDGGDPYHFKIVVDGDTIKDIAVLNQMVAAINTVKNVRSWLDGIEFKQVTLTNLKVGAIMYEHKEVVISG